MAKSSKNGKFLSGRGITKTYRMGEQELTVLREVDIDVAQRELLTIVGPSGAGKSTLLHILGVLDSPTQGTVSYKGEVVSTLSDARKARLRNSEFGFVFQFFHLLPDFTALENVAMPCLIDSRPERRRLAWEKAAEILDRVGLGDRLKHRPDQLSGGERQRVAIARALANEPAALLCDEPTGNLDSKTSAGILELLFDLNETLGLTVVIVTHDDRIAQQTPRIMRLADGKVIADERPGRDGTS